MVLNAAVQMLREAEELKDKISKFKSGTSMLQERSLWTTQQQLQKIYQKVLILDLDYALDKKVEQDLWNVGFKQQIEALQAISKDKKNPLRSEGQAMLSWVLQAAAGFYLCLLHQICTAFQLDLPFRRRASLLGYVEGWGASETATAAREPAPGAARYVAQHCLVHLGDLARYRHQLRVAHTFYRHALAVCPHSGQPYNQLALVMLSRGRRVCGVYWHVRSLLVRAPFPPAANNLARALAPKHAETAPPWLGAAGAPPAAPALAPPPTLLRRMDANTFATEFLRAVHYIHHAEQLELASALVDALSTAMISLFATDTFESMTLIKISCIIMWIVEDTRVEGGEGEGEGVATAEESRAAEVARRLARAAFLALLLPHRTATTVHPPIKVWLQWMWCNVSRLRAWAAWGATWAALADTLTHIAHHADNNDTYASVPLPEDVELLGFLPLAPALTELSLPPRTSHVPPYAPGAGTGAEVPTVCLSEEPELQKRVRAHRILQLGKQIADLKPECITYVEEESRIRFTAREVGGPELEVALEQLSLAQAPPAHPSHPSPDHFSDSDDDSERPSPPPPTVISEADFREKVREKRAGILKPQGSLERAREERAMATQEDADENSEESKGDDKKESKKSRVNIAMAAIMRKQEEINKQVKFVSPPPTPDSTPDTTESKEDKPKFIQPKAIKSLANLPLGRKTGGILSLKDKSAGYPHLVNNEEKKPEKEEKKDPKPQPQHQNYPKRENSQTNWTPAPPQTFNEPRNFQKNYGIQNAGLSYNPNYQPQQHQSIRLPVVNPKEIDVRTAALQKQNSRQDMFQENHKFNYQISGDKKNFLNDLPPRFANQYRYWQTPDNQFNENKFRDDTFKSSNSPNMFNQRWVNPPQMDASNYQQPPWWKPENQSPNFNYSGNMMQQPNFFTPLNSNVPNPYQNVQFNMNKPDQPYLPSTIGQPMQTLQSLVSSPNFNSSLSNFNSYPAVPYDSTMYPQFSNKMAFPMQKPLDIGVGFPNNMDMQRNANFENKPDAGPSSLEQNKVDGQGIENAGNTYSLFSGTGAPSGWGAPHSHPQQSLWSGPGPSPLERLLEQQKQMKPPSQ